MSQISHGWIDGDRHLLFTSSFSAAFVEGIVMMNSKPCVEHCIGSLWLPSSQRSVEITELTRIALHVSILGPRGFLVQLSKPGSIGWDQTG